MGRERWGRRGREDEEEKEGERRKGGEDEREGENRRGKRKWGRGVNDGDVGGRTDRG